MQTQFQIRSGNPVAVLTFAERAKMSTIHDHKLEGSGRGKICFTTRREGQANGRKAGTRKHLVTHCLELWFSFFNYILRPKILSFSGNIATFVAQMSLKGA